MPLLSMDYQALWSNFFQLSFSLSLSLLWVKIVSFSECILMSKFCIMISGTNTRLDSEYMVDKVDKELFNVYNTFLRVNSFEKNFISLIIFWNINFCFNHFMLPFKMSNFFFSFSSHAFYKSKQQHLVNIYLFIS